MKDREYYSRITRVKGNFASLATSLFVCILAAELHAQIGDKQPPLPEGVVARIGSSHLRHGRDVSALQFSADGKRLFSASGDFTVRIWDTSTSAELGAFVTDTSQILDMALSRDEKTLVTSTHRGHLFVWDVTSRMQVKQIGDETLTRENPATRIALSPDGKVIAAGTSKGIFAWNESTGTAVDSLKAIKIVVKDLSFSRDGSSLVGTSGSTLRWWNVKTGKLERTMNSAHASDRLEKFAISADGQFAAALNQRDGLTMVWDAKTGVLRQRVATPGKSRPWQSIALSPDGELVVLGSKDGYVRAIDWKDVKVRFEHWSHREIKCVAVSADGKTVATGGGGHDGAIRLWATETGIEKFSSTGAKRQLLMGIAQSSDGKRLATVSIGGTVVVWDLEAGKQICHMQRSGCSGLVRIAFSPDGKTVATSGHRTVALWSSEAGKLLGELPIAVSGQKRRIKFTPDGRKLIAAGSGGRLSVWNMADRSVERVVPAHNSEIWSMDVSPDGSLIVTGSQSGEVGLWSTETGASMVKLTDLTTMIRTVRFSPDGMRVAAGSSTGEYAIAVWEVATGKLIRKLQSDWAMTSLAFVGSGRLIVCGHFSDRLYLWDVATGKRIDTLRGPPGPYSYEVLVSPDIRKLYTAGSDSVVNVWDLPAMVKKIPSLEKVELNADDLQANWNALSDDDPAKAEGAIWNLVAAGKPAIEFLSKKLTQIKTEEDNDKIIRRLIHELDADNFKSRESAFAKLREMGPCILPLLEREMRDSKSVEARFRVKTLISLLKGAGTLAKLSPNELQSVRAVQVLAFLDTPEAHALLKRLATANTSRVSSRCANDVVRRLTLQRN